MELIQFYKRTHYIVLIFLISEKTLVQISSRTSIWEPLISFPGQPDLTRLFLVAYGLLYAPTQIHASNPSLPGNLLVLFQSQHSKLSCAPNQRQTFSLLSLHLEDTSCIPPTRVVFIEITASSISSILQKRALKINSGHPTNVCCIKWSSRHWLWIFHSPQPGIPVLSFLLLP